MNEKLIKNRKNKLRRVRVEVLAEILATNKKTRIKIDPITFFFQKFFRL